MTEQPTPETYLIRLRRRPFLARIWYGYRGYRKYLSPLRSLVNAIHIARIK